MRLTRRGEIVVGFGVAFLFAALFVLVSYVESVGMP